MRQLSKLSIFGVLLALCACKTDAVRAEVPAHVVDPTPEGHAELVQVVSNALGGRSVTIAEDALTQGSMLIIGPKYLTGRDLGKPEQFQLLLNGSECFLVHLGSDTLYALTKVICAAD